MEVLQMKNDIKIKNKQVIHIMVGGIKACLLLSLISVFILQLYCEALGPQAFYTGIALFKSSMFYIVMFIICGCVFNKINV